MKYNKYGEAAIEAVKLLNKTESIKPKEAWELSTQKIFGEETPAQKKSCPKDTFLTICEKGKLKKIKPGNYTKSKKNKSYALHAIQLIEKKPTLASNPNVLWSLIPDCKGKKSNNQMDVVVSLWNSGYWKK